MAAHPHCTSCPSRMDSIFKDLQGDHLKSLDAAKTTNQYKRGQILFYEGNPCKGLFCVAQGQIKLVKNGDNGKETILRIIGPGGILGIRGILGEDTNNATAQVMQDAMVCFVGKHFIHKLISDDSSLALRAINRMGSDLAETEDRLADLTSKPVRKRFSQLLLTLQKTHGKKESQGIQIDLRISRAELASMVGATPETVIRLLSDFKDLGYVHLEGKQIFIKDSEGLLQEAELDI